MAEALPDLTPYGTASTATSSEEASERDKPAPLTDSTGYTIREQPFGTKRKIKVIMIGAGASALNFFKEAEEQLENVEIVCYEKNHDIGGTWLENRYPGCACDIPSANYQFSWKTKVWDHFYSYAPEIWRYFKDIYTEHDFINKYVKLEHRIEHVQWDSTEGKWKVRVRDLRTDTTFEDAGEFFINGGGVLNKWKWPDIEGLHTFEGKLMHSANYEEGYPLDGKKVAVIGAGSSGVQIVSAIQPRVSHLYHWIRSPIWITAGFAESWASREGANFAYSEEQKKLMTSNPKAYLEYRKQIENELNQRFHFILKNTPAATLARTSAHETMTRRLNSDPRLCNAIIPKTFNPGCRRPTPAPGYLESLLAPNTTVFTSPITRITPTGFIDADNHPHDVDVIICATGFDTTWLPSYPFIGPNSVPLSTLWSPENGGITSYLSLGIPTFPNTFSFAGPYGPLAHGSFLPLLEAATQYILAVISKVQIENIKSIAPSLRAARDFRQHADLFLQRTAWTSPCRSWFKQGLQDGQAAVYPGSRLHYLHLISAPGYEDFDIEYWDSNRFAFLGNGFDTREFDGRDITHYLGHLGEEDVQPEFDDALKERLAGWTLGREREVRGEDGW